MSIFVLVFIVIICFIVGIILGYGLYRLALTSSNIAMVINRFLIRK